MAREKTGVVHPDLWGGMALMWRSMSCTEE
jgi:hypothetical protein